MTLAEELLVAVRDGFRRLEAGQARLEEELRALRRELLSGRRDISADDTVLLLTMHEHVSSASFTVSELVAVLTRDELKGNLVETLRRRNLLDARRLGVHLRKLVNRQVGHVALRRVDKKSAEGVIWFFQHISDGQ